MCLDVPQVVGQIVREFSSPLMGVHPSLLLATLLPLHKSNEMSESELLLFFRWWGRSCVGSARR
jgi:hypothetical protein